MTDRVERLVYRVETLNHHHLYHFWTVVREGGVTRASEKLHVSQPTVSGQVRELWRWYCHRPTPRGFAQSGTRQTSGPIHRRGGIHRSASMSRGPGGLTNRPLPGQRRVSAMLCRGSWEAPQCIESGLYLACKECIGVHTAPKQDSS